MGEAYFYHMTRQPLEATLPVLLQKSLQAGWRVLVRGQSPERLDWLDQRLWLGPEEGFLPHGLAGGPHDALQPVLLSTEGSATNGAACLMSVDGAEVTAPEAEDYTRVCILFDGTDASAVDHARGQWRQLTGGGVPAKYWSEEGGSWQMKAESA
ncbi:MAG: DNA polymerase III subunit chi [Pseudomonadota bacterium]